MNICLGDRKQHSELTPRGLDLCMRSVRYDFGEFLNEDEYSQILLRKDVKKLSRGSLIFSRITVTSGLLSKLRGMEKADAASSKVQPCFEVKA